MFRFLSVKLKEIELLKNKKKNYIVNKTFSSWLNICSITKVLFILIEKLWKTVF